jgi:hypothetical protein
LVWSTWEKNKKFGKFGEILRKFRRCLKEVLKGKKTTGLASLVVDFRKLGIRIFSGKYLFFGIPKLGFLGDFG